MELQQLFKECAKGSITAQKNLFNKYAQLYFLLCRRYMRTSEEAEEMMMNGFFNIFKTLKDFTYTNESAAHAWMKRIMVNECLQELRKRTVFLTVMQQVDNDLIAHDDTLTKLQTDEIFKLIMQLPVGYKTVFNLSVVEGYTHKEISQLLNISEGTSKSQLYKAKQMLQQLFNQENRSHEAKIV